jgi:CxxC motif-containing protein (DUF1111 family)
MDGYGIEKLFQKEDSMSLVCVQSANRIKIISLIVILLLGMAVLIEAQMAARDPGVRGGKPGAGGPLPDLSSTELDFFGIGQDIFEQVDSVQGSSLVPGTGGGLGARFNLDSCAGCHAHPATGGSSPAVNPQVAMAAKEGARNRVPAFITINGPVRVARFKFNPDGTRDGGVHNLYTITGRRDAPGCSLPQPDFAAAAASNNLSLRIPTPVFGVGLVESILDTAIIANRDAEQKAKRALGIFGHEARSANDGTITRFGWKAQVKSLEIFAGEAYNVEMGISNALFPTDREETPACVFIGAPRDHLLLEDSALLYSSMSSVLRFGIFMRFLAPPTPVPDTPSIARGRALFDQIGCALCHTPSLGAGIAGSKAFGAQQVNLYSDLLLHKMGPGLADNIVQGNAGPDEFRTAPLWGLGQRIFFLHDGRTRDLVETIRAHASPGDAQFAPSEANRVIANFNALSEPEKQDLLNFLRGL